MGYILVGLYRMLSEHEYEADSEGWYISCLQGRQ